MKCPTLLFLIALLALFGPFQLVFAQPDESVWFELDFEVSDGYVLGDLLGQTENPDYEWRSLAGTAGEIIVSDGLPTSGDQCVFMSSEGKTESLHYYHNGTPADLPDPVTDGYICWDSVVYADNPYQADGTSAFFYLGQGTTPDITTIHGLNGDIWFHSFNGASWDQVPIVEDYIPGHTYRLCVEWDSDRDAGENVRYSADGVWTDWSSTYSYQSSFNIRNIQYRADIYEAGDYIVLDNIGEIPPQAENVVTFSTPDDYSTQTSSFNITGTWSNVDPVDYTELNLFLGREDSFSMQFLCETSIETLNGNFSCLVDKTEWYQQDWVVQPILTLKECDSYGNCTYYNDKASNDPTLHITFAGDFSTSSAPALTIEGYTFEGQWDSFEGFYASTSDKWSTSTQVGLTLNATIGAITDWLYNLSSQLTILDTDKEIAGQEVGLAIRKARGYLETINNLFADFPLGQIFTIYIVVFLLVLVLRLIKFIRGMIK